MNQVIHLIGGGWNPLAAELVYGPFLADAGTDARIACLVLDEGDGQRQFERWAGALRSVAECRPTPVLLRQGETLNMSALTDTDALFVCGGLTPAYAEAVAPSVAELRQWLSDRPYGGFSAGASIASSAAVAGGWLMGGRPVIGEDASEDLDEITVIPGLGLVPFLVDVHAAQWGTLARLLAAVDFAGVPGVAIDENTSVQVSDGVVTVAGVGHVHLAVPTADGVVVRRFVAGDQVPAW